MAHRPLSQRAEFSENARGLRFDGAAKVQADITGHVWLSSNLVWRIHTKGSACSACIPNDSISGCS